MRIFKKYCKKITKTNYNLKILMSTIYLVFNITIWNNEGYKENKDYNNSYNSNKN